MSALYLNYPQKPHELSDDLESFVHVIIWLWSRFQDHTLATNPTSLETFVMSTYLAIRFSGNGYYLGSALKEDFMCRGTFIRKFGPEVRLNSRNSPAFEKLVQDLLRLCQSFYVSCVDWQDIEKYSDDNAGPSDSPVAALGGPKVTFDHAALLKCIDDALARRDWIAGDKLDDHFEHMLITGQYDLLQD